MSADRDVFSRFYVCELCKKDNRDEPFLVPADSIGAALMQQHLREHFVRTEQR